MSSLFAQNGLSRSAIAASALEIDASNPVSLELSIAYWAWLLLK
jgi:hypothetical protein